MYSYVLFIHLLNIITSPPPSSGPSVPSTRSNHHNFSRVVSTGYSDVLQNQIQNQIQMEHQNEDGLVSNANSNL